MTVQATADLGAAIPHRDLAAAAPQQRGRWVVFYLLMPLLMATPLGWYGAGIASQMSRPVALLLWALVCCLSWWVSDLCTRLLGLAAGRWRDRRLLLLIGGFGLNIALARYYSPAVIELLLRVGLVEPTPMITNFFAIERDLLDPHYVSSLLGTGIPGVLYWLAGNVVFERFYGTQVASRPAPSVAAAQQQLPGGETAAAASTTTAEPPAVASGASSQLVDVAPAATAGDAASKIEAPRFFQRLSRLAGLQVDELVAVEAEDHYVQVHSLRGKELVHYRFRDALAELEAVPGVQIHRSAWVSRGHVAALDGHGRKLEVVLSTGARFKVSLSNRGALLQAGLRQ